MTTLTALPLADVLNRLAAPTAAPGGGAAAALTGALGSAVGAMVATLPPSRHDTPDDRTRLARAAATLHRQRLALAALADADTAAVTSMMAAARARKASADADDAARTVANAAVADTAREATRVPLETARRCGEALDALRDVAACGARVAMSDVFVAVALLKAAADAAASNVRANLADLGDEAFVGDATRQLTRTLDGVARAAHAAMALLQE